MTLLETEAVLARAGGRRDMARDLEGWVPETQARDGRLGPRGLLG